MSAKKKEYHRIVYQINELMMCISVQYDDVRIHGCRSFAIASGYMAVRRRHGPWAGTSQLVEMGEQAIAH